MLKNGPDLLTKKLTCRFMLGIKVGQIQLGSYDKDTEFQMWVFVFKLAGFGKPLMVLNGRVT